MYAVKLSKRYTYLPSTLAFLGFRGMALKAKSKTSNENLAMAWHVTFNGLNYCQCTKVNQNV